MIKDPEKIEKRKQRFGTQNQTVPLKKPKLRHSAPSDEIIDPEELERRRKRAERFGI